LNFSLFSCEGSELLTRLSNRGIDVDCGSQCVDKIPPCSVNQPPGVQFNLRTQKNIRYSDFLNRQMPNEGPLGAGQFLSYMAPAIVGLWMNELLKNLYCQV
jgi:hypothetical protein